MPTRVFLLRHAETANPHVFHGAESDVGLSDKGRRQAEAIAEYLANLRPGVVISSGMRRARETAVPIARACDLALQVEPELHERRVGALSGTPSADPGGAWPQTARRWAAGETGYAPPGAESFDAIRDRVVPVWRRITQQHEGRTVVVVAHGIVCKVLLLSLLPGFGVADWPRLGPIRNVAVSELLEADSAWQAVRLIEQPEVIRVHGLH
jgi:broad specificity phosphatase PhoE